LCLHSPLSGAHGPTKRGIEDRVLEQCLGELADRLLAAGADGGVGVILVGDICSQARPKRPAGEVTWSSDGRRVPMGFIGLDDGY
jgi:hypothetical protein